jgi:hypothetical protein
MYVGRSTVIVDNLFVGVGVGVGGTRSKDTEGTPDIDELTIKRN